MKKGDYIKFGYAGENCHGMVVDFLESRAKNVVNRAGFVELVRVLKSDGQLIEMVIAPHHQFVVIQGEKQ